MVSYARAQALALVGTVGRYGILMGRAFAGAGEVRLYYHNLLRQMVSVGIESIPIVALASAFTGAVATVQAIYQAKGSPLLPPTVVGSFVTASITLELGGIIAAFILAGRVGARIAAELGTMRVTEQIDALETMGINSASYLLLPRIVAGVVMFPVLYVTACAIGISTGALVGSLDGFVSTGQFVEGARLLFRPYDVFFGTVKAFAFGLAITSTACFYGYFTRGGAEGVGASTTRATVVSCVFVLVADYVLAEVML